MWGGLCRESVFIFRKKNYFEYFLGQSYTQVDSRKITMLMDAQKYAVLIRGGGDWPIVFTCC